MLPLGGATPQASWGPPSIRHGKALAQVLRSLKLVDDGHGQVLHRDAARLITVHQQVVAADAELALALARVEHCRRRQEAPLQRGLAANLVERIARGLR